MAEYKGTLQTADGDILLPETSADQVYMTNREPLSDIVVAPTMFTPAIVDLTSMATPSLPSGTAGYTKQIGWARKTLNILELWIALEFTFNFVGGAMTTHTAVMLEGLPTDLGLDREKEYPVWDVDVNFSAARKNVAHAAIIRLAADGNMAIMLKLEDGQPVPWPGMITAGSATLHTSILI